MSPIEDSARLHHSHIIVVVSVDGNKILSDILTTKGCLYNIHHSHIIVAVSVDGNKILSDILTTKGCLHTIYTIAMFYISCCQSSHPLNLILIFPHCTNGTLVKIYGH
jgi:hypothetical protein